MLSRTPFEPQQAVRLYARTERLQILGETRQESSCVKHRLSTTLTNKCTAAIGHHAIQPKLHQKMPQHTLSRLCRSHAVTRVLTPQTSIRRGGGSLHGRRLQQSEEEFPFLLTGFSQPQVGLHAQNLLPIDSRCHSTLVSAYTEEISAILSCWHGS